MPEPDSGAAAPIQAMPRYAARPPGLPATGRDSMTRRPAVTDDDGGDRLTVALEARAGSRVLVLTGELEHDSAQVLREALDGCVREGPARILIDFAGVVFCDSTGLNVLLRARQEALAADRRLELCALGAQVARLFEMTGAADVFPVHPSVAGALAAQG